MNPQSSYSQNPNSQQKRLRAVVILFVLFLVFSILMFASTFIDRTTTVKRSLHPTQQKFEETFGFLHEDHVHAYNGLAFYRYSVLTGDVYVLSTGHKLPHPRRVIWAGTNGALLNFSHSFSPSIVGDALEKRGESLNPVTQNYTWYLDFRTGQLHMVDRAPVSNASTFYSASSSGFYYIPDYYNAGELEHEGVDFSKRPLMFFDIKNFTRRTINNDLGVGDISHINNCPDENGLACLVVRDAENPKLMKVISIDKEGSTSVLLEANNRIIPTNKPEYYLATNVDTTDEASDSGHIEEDVDPVEAPATLHNLKLQTESALGMKIGGNEIITYIEDSGDFYILDPTLNINNQRNKGYGYWSGKIINPTKAEITETSLPLEEKQHINRLGAPYSYGDNGLTLLTDSLGNQIMFGAQEGDNVTLPSHSSRNQVVEKLEECRGAFSSLDYLETGNLIRVYFNDDSTLQAKLAAFGNCIKNKEQVLVGFNYYLGTVSPINGRITSD